MENINWGCETTYIWRALCECKQIDETKKGHLDMSEKKLLELYDKIENGLISYEFIMKKGPESYKAVYGAKGGELGNYLESRLLTIVLMSTMKSPLKSPPQRFIDSWGEKWKDKQHYDKIFQIGGMHPSHKDFTYNLLLNKEDIKTV